ncbi:pyroglutamyl-peptidase I family protein [Salinarimonas ramus]|uniref:Pyrrolidone-carboxylate peptidase n=1 Tax=Salinarimonas ramus TaxID=690164 RepID=A0A917Q4B6_9HYPH|nr:peptidase C15 [Salinarimonas ramus]GGK19793.1 peptidase C15 [Salinarimonas ramus]
MTRLLITGFGPFPGVPRNPTERLARRLAADPRWRRRGVEARALVLPTTWRAVDEILLPAIRETRPDAVLMLGVAARRRAITIETRAVNRVGRLLPDASGGLPARLAYRLGEPFVRRARIGVPQLLHAMNAAAPGTTRLSRNAGRYLCNASSYAALAESGPRALVFVHVPLPRDPARATSARPSEAQTRRALAAATAMVARAGRRAHPGSA